LPQWAELTRHVDRRQERNWTAVLGVVKPGKKALTKLVAGKQFDLQG